MTSTELRDTAIGVPDPGWESHRLPRQSRHSIARVVLEARLDRGLREQVTVVRAPAGYGKTSLVRKWLDRPVVSRWAAVGWVDLDLAEGGAEGFWRSCRVALGVEDKPMVQSVDPIAEIQEVISQRRGTVVLVVDGYSRNWDAVIAGELVPLLRRTPNLHLMVLTRALTSFESPALAAVLDLVVIQNDDLAFDRSELEGVARALDLDLKPHVLDHIQHQSRGWPLVARAMMRIFDDPRAVLPEPVAARALEEIAQRVAAELLAQASTNDAERGALQRAAVAPYLAPPIVARIEVDGTDSDALAVAEESGLGFWTYARGQGRPVFEFLEPVRSVLCSQLEAVSPGEGERLASELREALESSGDPITPLHQALRANDIAAAESIVARNWTSPFTADADDYLEELRAFEPGALRSSVILLTVTGLLLECAGGDPLRAFDYYHEAVGPQALRTRRLEPAREYWADVTSMIALRKLGRLSHAEDFLVAVTAPDPSIVVPPIAWLEMGLTQLRLGRAKESVMSFERAAIGSAEDPDLYVFASGAAALAYALYGEMDRAQVVASRIEAYIRSGGPARSVSFAPLSIAYQLIAVERRHRESGTAAVYPVSTSVQFGELHSYSAFTSALRALAVGEYDEVQRVIDAELLSKDFPVLSNSESARFVTLSADLLMSQGNLVAAQKLIRAFPDGTNALRPVSARLLLMFREYRSAQLLAEAVIGGGTGPRIGVEMLLVQADALQRLKSARAETIWLNACQLADANKLATPFVFTIGGRVGSVSAASGDVPEPPTVAAPPIAPLFSEAAMAVQLTQRERIVLDRLQSSASLDHIARSLVVSINTVKTQTRSIYRKLGANSREEAVHVAYDLGLLRPRLPVSRNRYEGDGRIA